MRDLSLSNSDTPGLVEHLDIGRRNQFLFGLSGVTSTFSIIGIPVKTFNYKALGGTWVGRAKISAGISVLAVFGRPLSYAASLRDGAASLRL